MKQADMMVEIEGVRFAVREDGVMCPDGSLLDDTDEYTLPSGRKLRVNIELQEDFSGRKLAGRAVMRMARSFQRGAPGAPVGAAKSTRHQ